MTSVDAECILFLTTRERISSSQNTTDVTQGRPLFRINLSHTTQGIKLIA